MKTTQHTTAPWKLVKTTTKGEFGIDYKIRNNQDSLICTIGPNSQDANARLIAAAPDLLLALEMLVLGADNDLTTEEIRAYIQKEARAAIAKARGQS